MRIYSKSIKVIGLDKQELETLARLVGIASRGDKAEEQVSPTEYLAIEVNETYGYEAKRNRR